MSTPEEKAEMLRKQVIAKVHWGAREQEVLDWLKEEKGIVGVEAARLLAEANSARKAAIRTRALITLSFSAVFIAITIGYLVIQIRGGFVLFGRPVAVFLFVGGLSVVCFIRSLRRLLTGKTPGPID